jgi:hypothetical protein
VSDVHLTPEEKLAAKKWRKYLKSRKKELMVPLPKNLADVLGDIRHGTLVTVREWALCCERASLIEAGLIERPSTAATDSDVAQTKKAA